MFNRRLHLEGTSSSLLQVYFGPCVCNSISVCNVLQLVLRNRVEATFRCVSRVVRTSRCSLMQSIGLSHVLFRIRSQYYGHLVDRHSNCLRCRRSSLWCPAAVRASRFLFRNFWGGGVREFLDRCLDFGPISRECRYRQIGDDDHFFSFTAPLTRIAMHSFVSFSVFSMFFSMQIHSTL